MILGAEKKILGRYPWGARNIQKTVTSKFRPFWGTRILLNYLLGWPTGGKGRYKLPRSKCWMIFGSPWGHMSSYQPKQINENQTAGVSEIMFPKTNQDCSFQHANQQKHVPSQIPRKPTARAGIVASPITFVDPQFLPGAHLFWSVDIIVLSNMLHVNR